MRLNLYIMKNLKLAAEYKKFRLNKLNTPEFSYLWLLLYWPFYGIVFFVLERVLNLQYIDVYSRLDDYIPFCEYFIIPYYFWFAFLIGMLLYSLLFNIDTYRKYMMYIIITYSITLVIYIIFPTEQNLRPLTFERHNIFTIIASKLYNFDTNTNVCPSIHVIGSLAVCFAAWNDDNFSSFGWRFFFAVSTVLISMSTVFLKQHSIVDVFFAIILSAVCYPFVFGKRALRYCRYGRNKV